MASERLLMEQLLMEQLLMERTEVRQICKVDRASKRTDGFNSCRMNRRCQGPMWQL